MCNHHPMRRRVLTGIVTGIGLLALPRLPLASDPVAPSGHATPSITPDQALQWLKEGNQRFLNGTPELPNLTPQRIAETFNHGQHPFATLISCSDSRVPVEHIFDRGIGDLFVIRVAGNVAGRAWP